MDFLQIQFQHTYIMIEKIYVIENNEELLFLKKKKFKKT